ncbi:MAG: DUF6079 family protein [Verrucomicrobiae bacterium]|nr:DUF6079 family protein [Verrucomicrobiae bacterium]
MSQAEHLKIGDLIEVPPVQTVIRLEEGRAAPDVISRSFVFTAQVAAHFDVLAEAFARETGQGYFLQGDFGSGKSHFLAALTAWLEGSPAAGCLETQHPGLRRLRQTGRRFLTAAVSLVNFRASTPLERIIVNGIEESLARHRHHVFLTPLGAFWQSFKQILAEPALAAQFAGEQQILPDQLDDWFHRKPRESCAACLRFLKKQGLAAPEILVEDRHETFRRVLDEVKNAGFNGLVLLLDELSEFLRSKPGPAQLNEDARTLQFLGEAGSHSPVWILAALQESVERTGDIAQPTLRKIKDRYPVRLPLSTVHIRDLLARRLVKVRSGAAEKLHDLFASRRRHFPAFDWSYDEFRASYPVHPLTLKLLDGLSDLFSQHRGIVDFVHARVAGDASRAIPGILDHPASELLAPDSIYEHFAERLAGFSAFHLYPRSVIPHFDEVIGKILSEKSDQTTARRLVRILALYAVHPAAKPPPVRVLAELVSCMLATQDPDLNAQYVAEVILDPLVKESRFLTKTASVEGGPLDAVYSIVTQENHAKILERRVARIAGELPAGDTRALKEVLLELSESPSWPGAEVVRAPQIRVVHWRLSSRSAAVAFVDDTNDAVTQQMADDSHAGRVDFAFVLRMGKASSPAPHTAVWLIPPPGETEAVPLREYFAAKTVAAELRPANPSDAPLISHAAEMVRRLEPLARQTALNVLYAGRFADDIPQPEQAVRQLRRFDRLLELAGEHLLEKRFPKFCEIAPRLQAPSPRLYQRLIDEFVIPGAISLRDARTRGVAESIEALAAPLGLVSTKAASYTVSPDPSTHPFLRYFFSLLNAAKPSPLAGLLRELQTGCYGAPRDTAAFLLAALAHGGWVSLLSRQRTLPVDFLRLDSIDKADAIAPGELISQADRDTLIHDCPFLAPPQGWAGFGLRQQRDAWQAALKFSQNLRATVLDLNRALNGAAEYSAFAAFDLSSIQARLEAAGRIAESVRVSFAAREGLERFLQTWRGAGLTAADIDLLQRHRKFFLRVGEQFIFIHHYLRHRAVETAAELDSGLAEQRDHLLSLLRNPQETILPDEGAAFIAGFAAFRDAYVNLYRHGHGVFHQTAAKPHFDKTARRALDVLRALADIASLDRPAGLDLFLQAATTAPKPVCDRNLAEELLRSPVCGCGFQIGEKPPKDGRFDAAAAVEGHLQSYVEILRQPAVLEPLAARSYALRDMDARASERLRRLGDSLRNDTAIKPAALLDLLDSPALQELKVALNDKARLAERPLAGLTGKLAGRRLTADKIRTLVNEWLADPGDGTIFAIQGEFDRGGGISRGDGVAPEKWWPLLHEGLVSPAAAASPSDPQLVSGIASTLEESFPSESLRPAMAGWPASRLWSFLQTEPCHLRAVQVAWEILVRQLMDGAPGRFSPAVTVRLWPAENAAALRTRLAGLAELKDTLAAPFPERLAVRPMLARICHDAWATRETQEACRKVLDRLEQDAEMWMHALPSVSAVPLAEPRLLVVLDALSPDIWLEIKIRIKDVPETQWQRLDAPAATVHSLNALLDLPLDNDPAEELSRREVPYCRFDGLETASIAEDLPAPSVQRLMVIHLAALDRDAHRGEARLDEQAGRAEQLLRRQLPGLIAFARRHSRPLLLTTDHGLSWDTRGLTHGKGGVFERAIFRVEFAPR